jgi:hypothetical protein
VFGVADGLGFGISTEAARCVSLDAAHIPI